MATDEYVEHAVARLGGELHSLGVEVQQLRDEIADLREGLHREQQNRAEALTDVWNQLHDLSRLGERR